MPTKRFMADSVCSWYNDQDDARKHFGYADFLKVGSVIGVAFILILFAAAIGLACVASIDIEVQEVSRTSALPLQAAQPVGSGAGEINPIVICAGDELEVQIRGLINGPVEYVDGSTTIRVDLQIENKGEKAVAARGEQWSGVDVSGNEVSPTWMTFGADAETGGHAYRQVLIDVGEVFDGTVFLKADGPLSELRYTPYVPVGYQPDPVTVDVSGLNIGHERRPR